MLSENNGNSIHFLSPQRIQGLADGIFAISMTLLILSLTFPDGIVQSEVLSSELILGQIHKFYNYALGFILLAIFWISHHRQFHYIKRIDHIILWINLFILLFIALMPFSVDLVGDYIGQWIALIFFCCNILILGILYFFNWEYATNNYRLTGTTLDKDIITKVRLYNLILLVVPLIVVLVSLFVYNYAILIFLVMPFLELFVRFRLKNNTVFMRSL